MLTDVFFFFFSVPPNPQPSSVYSRPPLSSVGRSDSGGYQGPRRANTSSTASGAYPRELRRDEDSGFAAAAPTPSWLPAPPQSVSPSVAPSSASARAPLPGYS